MADVVRYVPGVQMAQGEGHRDAPVLRGNARHVYEVVDDNNYTMKIQFSPDAEGWADVLTGTDSETIRRHGHDQLKTFGAGRDRSARACARP